MQTLKLSFGLTLLNLPVKRKLLPVIILLFLSYTLEAQNIVDVVYLNNGNIIKGKIIENNPENIKIETCCGSIFNYPFAEIKKIESEYSKKTGKSVKSKGYMNYTSMGVLMGSSNNSKKAPFSFIMEHDYRFHKYFAAGGLIGFEKLNESVMPLAISMKAMLPLTGCDVYFGISGGYSFSLEDPEDFMYKSMSGGILGNLETGVIIPFSPNTAFFVAIGYRYNELNYTRTSYWNEDIDRVVYYNRISFKFGLAIY